MVVDYSQLRYWTCQRSPSAQTDQPMLPTPFHGGSDAAEVAEPEFAFPQRVIPLWLVP